jgi:simple sugar transport system substrate-binding protein
VIDRAAFLRLAVAAGAGGGLSLPKHPSWNITLLSYNTIDPLFVAMQYGAQDASALIGCSVTWGGSARGDAQEVAKAFDSAIDAHADAIAVAVVDPQSLARGLQRAAKARIPVLALNVRSPGTGLALVGMNPREAGAALGARIASSVGAGEAALFVGDPAHAALAPLIDATVAAVERSGKVTAHVVPTGPDIYAQLDTVYTYVSGHKDARGLFALDVGSTEGLTNALEKLGLDERIHAGGSGVLPDTLKLIDDGTLAFTIDEQPYLQGFSATIELFLAKLSGGLLQPCDVRTGPLFVTRKNVGRYLNTKTRYEGSSSLQKYPVS